MKLKGLWGFLRKVIPQIVPRKICGLWLGQRGASWGETLLWNNRPQGKAKWRWRILIREDEYFHLLHGKNNQSQASWKNEELWPYFELILYTYKVNWKILNHMSAFSIKNKQLMLQNLTRKHMKFRLTRFVAAPEGCLTCLLACPPVQRFAQLFFVTMCVVVSRKQTHRWCIVWSTCGESGDDSLLPHEGAKDCNNSLRASGWRKSSKIKKLWFYIVIAI